MEPSPGWRRRTSHEGSRPASRLPEHELGGRGDLVGDGAHGRGHEPAVGVACAAQVLERPEARNADRQVGDPEAPRAPQAVRDDDARGCPEAGPEPVPDPARGRVGVLGKQQHDLAALPANVAGVHAGVGKDEAVARLGDDHAVRHADDADRLPQDDLDLARVRRFQRAAKRGGLAGAAPPPPGRRRRPPPSRPPSGSRPGRRPGAGGALPASRRGHRRAARRGRPPSGPRGAARAAGRAGAHPVASGRREGRRPRSGNRPRPGPRPRRVAAAGSGRWTLGWAATLGRAPHGSSARTPSSPAASAARRSSGVSRSSPNGPPSST